VVGTVASGLCAKEGFFGLILLLRLQLLLLGTKTGVLHLQDFATTADLDATLGSFKLNCLRASWPLAPQASAGFLLCSLFGRLQTTASLSCFGDQVDLLLLRQSYVVRHFCQIYTFISR